jgi:chromate transporter
VGLGTIAREWSRIGCLGFGGPPTHIALLRQLCVERRRWITPGEFEDGIAATNLLPGPASTQLAILTAWRLRGVPGAMVGGLCFIVPGLVVILALATVFLSGSPPLWVQGAAAGAGAAVPAVAAHAAWPLACASWKRAGPARSARARWAGYLLASGIAAALIGPWLVVVLLTAGLLEVVVKASSGPQGRRWVAWPVPACGSLPGGALSGVPLAGGGLLAVGWVALKVGALSYGGGFVIIPLMQSDAVDHYHWMSGSQFLNAVALGQITPGPVVQTVAVVGYAAAGLWGGLLAAVAAFTPSFLFVVIGGPRFDRLRANERVQAFFAGAGPAVTGAIAGSAVPLTRALTQSWQYAVLAAAAIWLLAARRGVVSALLAAGALGVTMALTGWAVH